MRKQRTAPSDAPIDTKIQRLISHPLTGVLTAIVVVALAGLALHVLAGKVSWQDVVNDLGDYRPGQLAEAVAFTALSFSAIALYDVFGIAWLAPGRVDRRLAAATCASSYALTNLLGFSWLTGTAVRVRIYAELGLDWQVVIGLISSSWLAYWIATFSLLGGLLIISPTGLLAQFVGSFAYEPAIGVAIFAIVGLVFAALARGWKQLSLWRFRFPLPPLKLSLSQTALGFIDVIGAAGTLYVLLPPDLAHGLTQYFAVYMAAIALGLASHAPGGIGFFEAVIIAGLGAAGRSDVIAALTMYRLIYYVLPFTLAALWTGGMLAFRGRRASRDPRRSEPP